jgi:hypothetical protein
LFLQEGSRPRCALCKERAWYYCEDCNLVLCCSQKRNCFFTYHHSDAVRTQCQKDLAQSKKTSCFVHPQ